MKNQTSTEYITIIITALLGYYYVITIVIEMKKEKRVLTIYTKKEKSPQSVKRKNQLDLNYDQKQAQSQQNQMTNKKE